MLDAGANTSSASQNVVVFQFTATVNNSEMLLILSGEVRECFILQINSRPSVINLLYLYHIIDSSVDTASCSWDTASAVLYTQIKVVKSVSVVLHIIGIILYIYIFFVLSCPGVTLPVRLPGICVVNSFPSVSNASANISPSKLRSLVETAITSLQQNPPYPNLQISNIIGMFSLILF